MKPGLLLSLASAILIISTVRSSANDRIIFDDFGRVSALMQSRCITQDESGKIWFGTNKYLCDFDGYEIHSYLSDEGNVVSTSICIDKDRVILGTNKGLYLYDSVSGKISNTNIVKGSEVKGIVECANEIYVGTENGVFRLEGWDEGAELRANCIFSGIVNTIISDGDDLLIGAVDGLKRYSHADKRLDAYLSVSQAVFSIYPDGEFLWLGTSRHIQRTSKKDGHTDHTIRIPMPKCLQTDNNGNLYIGTDRGLLRYSTGLRKIETVSNSIVWDFCEDRDKNIWMATDNGLMRMRQESLFSTLPLPDAYTGEIYDKMLLDSKGRLWLGGLQGLLLVENYNNEDFSATKFSVSETRNSIPHNKIRNIREDASSGEVIIATDANFGSFDEQTKLFKQKFRINRRRVFYYDILRDSKFSWVGTFSGMYKLDQNGNILKRYSIDNGLSDNDVPSLAMDSYGDIWVLTRDQKIHVLPHGHEEIQRKDFSKSISKPFASCLISDREGTIWIGISNHIIRASGVGIHEMEDISLNASESVETYSMTDIGDSILACTSEGIFIISKDNLSVKLINNTKNYISSAYDKTNQTIILSGRDGVDLISKEKLPELLVKRSHKVEVTRIVINGSYELPYAEWELMDMKLGHDNNNISVYLSDFSYSTASPKFTFKLISRKSELKETVSSNSIILTDLKPGRYSLLLYNAEASDISPTELKIRIKRPWYNTPPMLCLYFCLVLGIILLTTHLFTMKQKLALQKQQQDNITEQSRQKEDFFISVAHEFKTPLSLIIAPLGKLIHDCPDQGKLSHLYLAQDNALKLNALIHKTLDYYNNSKGIVGSLITTEVEFVDFARSIFNSYKENHKDHEFIFSSNEEEIIAYVDIVKMEIILNNLLSNACKYSPGKGSIILSIEKQYQTNEIMIKLSDTGLGIPEQELPFIFERYFESSRTKDGNYDSTGIGLSIVKKYVEMHKGKIGVDSDNYGTTFTISLPCLEQSISRSVATKNSKDKNNDKALVVIVDDNIQICRFLESVLGEKYRCISAHNGKSGLKLCTDLMPDLIIADVMMPVMDGLEMCSKIREVAPLSSIPIILLTAKGDSATENASINLNIDAFIAKPFDILTLAGRVDQLIGNKKRMEQSLRLEMISNPQKTGELSQDEKYLKRVTQLIEDNLDDSDFNVNKLCTLGEFNEKQLYRKIKQFTGMSVVEYIRSIRLKKAAILLQNGNFTISEVMYTVGFSNASYFSRAFQASYGKTPSEYMKEYKKQS